MGIEAARWCSPGTRPEAPTVTRRHEDAEWGDLRGEDLPPDLARWQVPRRDEGGDVGPRRAATRPGKSNYAMHRWCGRFRRTCPVMLRDAWPVHDRTPEGEPERCAAKPFATAGSGAGRRKVLWRSDWHMHTHGRPAVLPMGSGDSAAAGRVRAGRADLAEGGKGAACVSLEGADSGASGTETRGRWTAGPRRHAVTRPVPRGPWYSSAWAKTGMRRTGGAQIVSNRAAT